MKTTYSDLIPRTRGPFEYRPLNDSSEEIRLLRFIPHQPYDGSLAMEMKHFTLGAKCPRFEAISYRWDLSSPMSEVFINFRRFTVTNNVAALFKELKSHKWKKTEKVSSRLDYIWIDAICINQNDIRERNHQVKLMRAIYSTAFRVLAWLGPATNDSEIAVNHIEFSAELYDRTRKPSLDDESLDNLRALKSFLTREYWTRIWVVQELLLAKQIIFLCGDRRFEWSTLKRMYKFLQRLVVSVLFDSEKRQAVWEILGTGAFIIVEERASGTSDTRELIDLLDSKKFGGFKCSDRRDRVYGLLGICKERDQIVVDYHKSAEEVYIDVMQTLKDEIIGAGNRRERHTYRLLDRLVRALELDNDSIRRLRQIMLPRVLHGASQKAQWINIHIYRYFDEQDGTDHFILPKRQGFECREESARKKV